MLNGVALVAGQIVAIPNGETLHIVALDTSLICTAGTAFRVPA